MTTVQRTTPLPLAKGEPTWEIARLFPSQGHWSVGEYLDLQGNHLIEYSKGFIEVLPTPTMRHQLIVMFLSDVLRAFLAPGAMGRLLVAPFRVRLSADQFREPDVMVMLSNNAHRMKDEYWEGADLVVEVVSPDDPKRDLQIKRTEYAAAGIPEYWIVDPQANTVAVLVLDGNVYTVYGEFRAGRQATSRLLPGFSVSVDEVFAVR